MEPTLSDHLDKLATAVDEYRAAVKKVEQHFGFEVEELWRDQAALRDEVHTNVTALSNRIENVTRGLTADPFAVAEAMVRKHGVPCIECGEQVYVDHADPELPSPIRNAADGTKHTCHVRAVPDSFACNPDESGGVRDA